MPSAFCTFCHVKAARVDSHPEGLHEMIEQVARCQGTAGNYNHSFHGLWHEYL